MGHYIDLAMEQWMREKDYRGYSVSKSFHVYGLYEDAQIQGYQSYRN